MSFILPRRLTQFARCAKSGAPKEAKQAAGKPGVGPKKQRGPGNTLPGALNGRSSIAPLLRGRLLRLWLVRMVGRRRRSWHRWNRRWLLHRLGLRFILALLLVCEPGLVACHGRG